MKRTNALTACRSATTTVYLPEFRPCAPEHLGTVNGIATIRLAGAVGAHDSGTGSQTDTLKLWDDDLLLDDLLMDAPLTVPHPTSVWDGLLIPYSAEYTGNVYLASGEASPSVYQTLVTPNGLYTSAKTTIPRD